MLRTKLDALLPDLGAVVKLVERYIKVERRVTVEQAVEHTCLSRTSYYNRLKRPGDLTLEELRSFAKALEIPREELLAAVADAVRY